jgi:hypothetical protein
VIELSYDPGIEHRWAVVKLQLGDNAGDDHSGVQFSGEEEAIDYAKQWNATNQTDQTLRENHGWEFRVVRVNYGHRPQWFVIPRKMARNLGLIHDKNEFGEITP